MSILTDRELEFLAGLHTGWSRLYWRELAVLLRENGDGRALSASLTDRTATEPRGGASSSGSTVIASEAKQSMVW
jgi:hypothetical protein